MTLTREQYKELGSRDKLAVKVREIVGNTRPSEMADVLTIFISKLVSVHASDACIAGQHAVEDKFFAMSREELLSLYDAAQLLRKPTLTVDDLVLKISQQLKQDNGQFVASIASRVLTETYQYNTKTDSFTKE